MMVGEWMTGEFGRRALCEVQQYKLRQTKGLASGAAFSELFRLERNIFSFRSSHFTNTVHTFCPISDYGLLLYSLQAVLSSFTWLSDTQPTVPPPP